MPPQHSQEPGRTFSWRQDIEERSDNYQAASWIKPLMTQSRQSPNIVGEHNRHNDLEINVLKGKQLTNVRASGTDEAVKLVPAKQMSLEQMMAYINEDELVEVTPQSLRLRKMFLDPHERKRAARAS